MNREIKFMPTATETTPGVFAPPDAEAPMPAERVTTTIARNPEASGVADDEETERATSISKKERDQRLGAIQKALADGQITEEESLAELAALGKGQRPAQEGGQKKHKVVSPEQRGTGGQEGYDDEEDSAGKPVGAGKGAGGSAEQKAHKIDDHPAGVSPVALPRAKTLEMRLEDRRNILGRKYRGAIFLRNLYRWLKPTIININSILTENRLVQTTGELFHYIRLARDERIKEEKARKAKKEAEERAKKNTSTTSASDQQEAVSTTAGVAPAQSEQKPAQPTNQTITESPSSAPEDIRAMGLKQIEGYIGKLTGNEDPDIVIDHINAIITNNNNQPGVTQEQLWEKTGEAGEQTKYRIRGVLDFVKQKSQTTTGQQKT